MPLSTQEITDAINASGASADDITRIYTIQRIGSQISAVDAKMANVEADRNKNNQSVEASLAELRTLRDDLTGQLNATQGK